MTVQIFNDAVEVLGSQDITQLTVQAANPQSQPLQVWLDNSSNTLARVTADGRFQVGNNFGGAADALIQANYNPTGSQPTSVWHTPGTVSSAGTISTPINWVYHELALAGTAGVSGLHNGLYSKLTQANSGSAGSAELRAATFQAINQGGSGAAPVGKLTGLRGTSSNAGTAYLGTAIGVEAIVTNDTAGSISQAAAFSVAPPINTAGTIGTLIGLQIPDLTAGVANYAIQTGKGLVSLGDNLNVSGTATPGAFKMTAGAGAGKVLTSDASGNGSWIAPVVQGGMINGKLATSVASNNFTLAIKTLAGNDPSVTDPVYVRIGNTLRAITAALSVTKNAGTNWMNLGSNELKTQDIDLFTYLGYNATDGVVIGFSPIPYARVYGDFSTTSTSETYAAISTITHATSTDEYENVGRFNVTLSGASAYNWSIPSTSIIINHPIDSTRLLVYVPTITAFSGSFTTISSLLAQFRRQGKQISLAVQFTVTTVGTASGETLVTTPYQTAATYVGSGLNSAAVSMLVYFTAPAQLAVRKYDSTFGVTSGTSLYLTCIYIGN